MPHLVRKYNSSLFKFPQIPGACALPMPHRADSKPSIEGSPQHLRYRKPRPLWFASLLLWPTASAGSWYKGTFG